MTTLTPAVLFEAASRFVNVRSFDGKTPCRAYCDMSLEIGRILMPEEAEQYGINLYLVDDLGVNQSISIGKELRDWRLIQMVGPNGLVDMGSYLYCVSQQESVWKNPRIVTLVAEWERKGMYISNLSEVIVAGKSTNPIMEKNKNIESDVFRYHPNLPIPSQEIPQGVYPDWTNFCLYFGSKKNATLICNFIPIPLRREYEFDREGNRKVYYVIRVNFFRYYKDLLVSESELGHLYPVVAKEVDGAVHYHAKINQKLEVYVRSQLSRMSGPDLRRLIEPGWQKVEGRMVYGMDNRLDNLSDVFATGRKLEFSQLNSGQVWQAFCKMWEVSRDSQITSVMMLYQLMGVGYNLYMEAEFPLTFVLYIYGTTGSLKTSLSKVLFEVFDENGEKNKLTRTFSDTVTSLEQYLGSLRDQTGLVDDFELGDSDSEAHRQMNIFNHLVRLVGDGKGKNRSNPALQDVKAKRPYGNLAMTGEQVMGKQSTRLRLIELEVAKGAISGEALSYFQENPIVWKTVCAHYIAFLEREYFVIVNFLRKKSNELRREYQQKFSHLRSVDQLVAFCLQAEITARCWIAEGIDPIVVNHVINRMKEDVESVLLQSAETDEETNPAVRFVLDLDAMIGAGEIRIADSFGTFKADPAQMGFYQNEDLFLLRDVSYEAVCTYESRMRRRFAFDLPKILRSMDDLELIVKQKNGASTTYGCKKAGRIFIQLRCDKLEEIASQRMK